MMININCFNCNRNIKNNASKHKFCSCGITYYFELNSLNDIKIIYFFENYKFEYSFDKQLITITYFTKFSLFYSGKSTHYCESHPSLKIKNIKTLVKKLEKVKILK